MNVRELYLRVNTAGAAGQATGSAATAAPGGVSGWLDAVYVKPNASGWAGTTDIVVREVGDPARTFLTLTNKTSAAAYYPVRVLEAGNDGGALTTYAPYALFGRQIEVVVEQANAQSPAVEVWLYIRS